MKPMKRPSAITAEEIEKKKKMRQKQNNLLIDDDEESNPDYDEDGNPLTIGAAQELYHGDKNPLYFPLPKYFSPKEANKDLI